MTFEFFFSSALKCSPSYFGMNQKRCSRINLTYSKYASKILWMISITFPSSLNLSDSENQLYKLYYRAYSNPIKRLARHLECLKQQFQCRFHFVPSLRIVRLTYNCIYSIIFTLCCVNQQKFTICAQLNKSWLFCSVDNLRRQKFHGKPPHFNNKAAALRELHFTAQAKAHRQNFGNRALPSSQRQQRVFLCPLCRCL